MQAFDEAQLVALVTQGDSRAFAELAQRHLPAIETYATRILADQTAAQDIAQETLLVLWQRSSEFKPEKARLTTWLHRVAHNRCIDLLRRQKRETPMPSADIYDRQENSAQGSGVNDVHDPTDIISVTSELDANPSAMDVALRRLPESQRTALVLTYYQNLSNREVASVMNSSTRAVESLLCRARGNLKKQLENQQ
ncbi:MAG: RNA polymerase [Proteobacteria bacterium]|nr:MAG: RNA polymerase [Pseudomonadota bacterium]